jgi:type I restriction-modification system DNA methylase subunit
MAVVLPHGALFRMGKEGEIRKKILHMDLLEAVIGLGPNLFYGTGLAACILVFRQKKAKDRKNKVLIVDASKEFKTGRAQNELLPQHVDASTAGYRDYTDVEGIAKVVTLDEIAANDHNLNIPRYVEPKVQQQVLSVEEAMAQLKASAAARPLRRRNQGQTLTGITYQDLASNIGLFNKHDEPHCRLGKSLGIMGHMIAAVDVGWGEKPPILQSLVVSKQNGLPSNGMNEFWSGYEKLSDIEKRSKSLAEWQVIADFGSRWNAVLRALGLDEVKPSLQQQVQQSKTRSKVTKAASIPRFGHGGESPAHQALKEHVKRNPHIVGP